MLNRREINRRARAAMAQAMNWLETGYADDGEEAVEMAVDAYTADLGDGDFHAVMRATHTLARRAGLLFD